MIDLGVVKEHCRLEPDFNADDATLNIYIGAAKKQVEMYTRRTLYATEAEPGYADDEDHLLLSDDVKGAMLLLIGNLYENREASVIGQSVTTLPFAVTALLQPYRIYGL
ncbi:Phage gp6-like head-tail connector protein [Serratia fonticola]|uniref:head-tail connector protein n=1 Tax=Serratia fonticola TaxID=47917 RepID=UPI00217C776B|nr:head-tail connector protein [Serratia fonticola]CAI0888714.1 Phage gp6-like head-tail connector protein [Serratia fonticola]